MAALATESVTLLPVMPFLGTAQAARKEVTTLIMRKNMFDWGSDYAVRDTDGNVVIVADAQPDSALGKMKILDASGKELYEIHERAIALQRTYVGHRSGGDIFSVHAHHTTDHIGTTTAVMRGWWKDNNGKHSFSLQGDFAAGTAVVWLPDTNQAIGKVLRQPANLDANFDSETYAVDIAPGVDVQEFAGIIIAVETLLAKELR